MAFLSTGVFSIIMAVFQLLLNFDGMNKLDEINLDNYEVKVDTNFTIKIPHEDDYYSDSNIRGIIDGDKSNYKLNLKSSEENFKLDSYYDEKSTFFDTQTLKDIAGDRASASLKEVKNDYVKSGAKEPFGFEMKYNFTFINEILKLFKDQEFKEIVLNITKFLGEEGLINAQKVNSFTIKVEDLSKYNKFVEKINSREDIKKDIVRLVNITLSDKETFTMKDLNNLLKNSTNQEVDIFIKMLKGTTFTFKSNSNNAIDFDVDFDIFMGEDKEKMNIKGTTNIKLQNSTEKVNLPKNFVEVSDKEYDKFFLSTYDNLAVITLKDKDKQISYINKLILHDNYIYIDEHIISQLAEEIEIVDKNKMYKREDKIIKITNDTIIANNKKIKAFTQNGINYYPLRKVAQELGYEIEFEDSNIEPRFFITLK